MTQDQELWQLEKQFWLGNAEFYETMLAPQALMIFPPPVGVLDRATTISSIRSAARWQNIAFSKQHFVAATQDTAVLAYVARADRGGADSGYCAQCSSVYIRCNSGWCLVLHQQTPETTS